MRCSHKGLDCTHRWTEAEDQYLRETHASYDDLAASLGRTREGVRDRWGKIRGDLPAKPRKTHRWAWTEEEDEFLRQNAYGILSHKQMAVELGRAWTAVAQRIITLGLTSNRHGGHWTSEGKRFSIPPYGWDWPQRRQDALERDGYSCQQPECRFFSPSAQGLDVHHVRPRKFGVDDEHLVTLCEPHHDAQPAHHWTEWNPEALPAWQLVRFPDLMGVSI